MNPRWRTPALYGALLFSAAACAQDANEATDADTPSVTAYRPTVSDPAALSAPGWFELETGISSVRGADATHTVGAPVVTQFEIGGA